MSLVGCVCVGHVIYEMSVGVELSRLTPIEEDYKQVKDENCREILKYIFEEKKSKSLKSKSLKFKRSIKDVSNHGNNLHVVKFEHVLKFRSRIIGSLVVKDVTLI